MQAHALSESEKAKAADLFKLRCPECGGTAEIERRTVLASTDGPIEHAKIRCVNRHWCYVPVYVLEDDLRVPSGVSSLLENVSCRSGRSPTCSPTRASGPSTTTPISVPAAGLAGPRRGARPHRRGAHAGRLQLAHLMLGALRSLDLGARHVSGYLETVPPPGRPRLVGADASTPGAGCSSPATGGSTSTRPTASSSPTGTSPWAGAATTPTWSRCAASCSARRPASSSRCRSTSPRSGPPARGCSGRVAQGLDPRPCRGDLVGQVLGQAAVVDDAVGTGHTVGAGGGSIARVDEGGSLRVGPESAGADPGPACYGRSLLPTVTDAHVVLGHFGGVGLLGGEFALDEKRSREAFTR